MIRTLWLLGVAAVALILVSRLSPADADAPAVLAETWRGASPWLVGALDDPFSYDGRTVRRIEGDAELRVGPTNDDGVLSVRLSASVGEPLGIRDHEGDLELRFLLDNAEMLVTDRMIHSATGYGDRRMPETRARVAGKGSFQVWLDGRRQDDVIHGFWSLADAVRREDGAIRAQGLVFSPLLRDRTVFSDPDRLEITVLLYGERTEDTVLLHLTFPVTP